MARKLFLSACLSLLLSFPAAADDYALPDIGTAGIRGLTVQREQQLGDYFMRMARAQLPIIDDPVLSEYLRGVGSRLVMHARDVRFPFTFFWCRNPQLNAAAFLGGKVMVNTGLIHYAQNEDEFAGVLAHEISHVTQRHLARFIESESTRTPMTLAGLIGSVAMGIINPALGMAALSTTMGVAAQTRINFTRDNEQEADRLGIDLLQRSGFDPGGMVSMFHKLLVQQGRVAAQFTLLLDHPLSEVRISEARSRVAQYPARRPTASVNFDLAQARVDVRYQGARPQELRERLGANPEHRSAAYRNYALALLSFEEKRYEEARTHLANLGALSSNLFVVDLLTDLDLQSGQGARAVERLRALYRKMPRSEAVALNLGNALLQSGRASEAAGLLRKFADARKDDHLALDLLAKAYDKSGNRCQALHSRARLLSLEGAYAQAQNLLRQALNTCSSKYDRETARARVAQLSEQRRFDETISKGGLR